MRSEVPTQDLSLPCSADLATSGLRQTRPTTHYRGQTAVVAFKTMGSPTFAATLRRPTVAVAALGLTLVSMIGAVATAYGILHNGFPLNRSPSLFAASIRVATILASLSMWRFVRHWLTKVTLLAWIVAAGSSALYYGVNMSTTPLQVVRAISHFVAYSLTAAVLIVGVIKGNSPRSRSASV